MTPPTPSRDPSSAGFEEPGGFEPADRLDPSADAFEPDRGDDGRRLSLAPAAAAFAAFALLRGLIPFLEVFVEVPRGVGAVLMLAAGLSGVALVVAGAVDIWRKWGM